MKHELKTWPEFFDAVWDGFKTFEIRKNDRNFQVGDILTLREWNPISEAYGPRCMKAQVKYIASGIPGIPIDMVAMSITVIWRGRY